MEKKRTHKMSPNSLANLQPPIQKGEVRNPTGINRKRPYTDRLFVHGEELLTATDEGEAIRKVLKMGPVWSKYSCRPLTHARTSLQAQVHDKSGLVDLLLGQTARILIYMNLPDMTRCPYLYAYAASRL